MDMTSLHKRQADIKNRYDELNQQLTNIKIELHRLEGKYNVLGELIEELSTLETIEPIKPAEGDRKAK